MAKLDPALYAEMEKICMDLFTYEQHFFFLNGPRATGKTYSLQKIMIKKALKTGCEIGYFCRTKDEWASGVVLNAFEKVFANEFPELLIEDRKHDVWCMDPETNAWRKLIVGFPLSQYYKWKNLSFPKVNFCLFDEYMLEIKDGITQGHYINGYGEPDALISLYDTIDRRESRLKVFFCGNNTSFYNPYHVHNMFKSAFRRVPKKGEIVKTNNVVFWRVLPSPELEKRLKETALAKMAGDTAYGTYAFDGEYQDDVSSVVPMTAGARTLFGLRHGATTVYVHAGMYENQEVYWLCTRGNANAKVYAVRGNDVTANVTLFAGTFWSDLFSTVHRSGRVFFADQKTKTICGDFLYLILSWYRKT